MKTTPEVLAVLGNSLNTDDKVIIESTDNAVEIARVLEPFVSKVVIVIPMHVRTIKSREGQERPVRRSDAR